MQTENIWTTLVKSTKQNKKSIIRTILIFLVIELVIIAAGIGIWIVTHGLFRLALYLIAYIQPIRQWFYTHIIKNQEFANQAMPKMNKGRQIGLIVSLTINIIMISIGGWIIFKSGFLGQNLIYILTTYSK